MRRPSIYSSNYNRIMRRRRIMIRTLIVFTVLAAVFLVYDKSGISYFKKFSSSIKLPQIGQSSKSGQDSTSKTGSRKDGGNSGKNQEVASNSKKNQITVNLSNGNSIILVAEDSDDVSKITGIQGNTGVFYTIRSDGKAIVFDYPGTGSIWIYKLDGGLKKLNPDNYKEFKKQSIMQEYSNYIWGARPYFLQDGRVVYQSNLPWFKANNSIYLWVVDDDGRNNRMAASTKQGSLVTYSGFDGSGNLVVEYGGSSHTISIKK